jgi:hypothetical protein
MCGLCTEVTMITNYHKVIPIAGGWKQERENQSSFSSRRAGNSVSLCFPSSRE